MLGLYSREAVARAHAARSFIAAMNSKSHASSLIGGWNFIPKWPTCQSWGSIKFAARSGPSSHRGSSKNRRDARVPSILLGFRNVGPFTHALCRGVDAGKRYLL